jgi:hypothetical protein
MSQHIIECVHKLARSEKMPEGMKVTSKTGVILYDNSWLPAVQCESTDDIYEEDQEKIKQEILEDEADNSMEIDENELYEIVEMKHFEENPMSTSEEENDGDIEIGYEPRNEEEHEGIQDLTNEEEMHDNELTNEEEMNDNGNPAEINDIGGIVTRSGRRVKPVIRTNLLQHDLPEGSNDFIEYGEESSKVIAQVIHKFNTIRNKEINQYGLLQTYNLGQGFYCYGERGKEAAFDEMRQLHARGVFVPVK